MHLVRTDRYSPKPEIATIICQRYYFKNGDVPNGYGKWIFTNPETQPLEIEGYYSSAIHIAQKHFKNKGFRFCYVSTDSHTLPNPKHRLKTKCKVNPIN